MGGMRGLCFQLLAISVQLNAVTSSGLNRFTLQPLRHPRILPQPFDPLGRGQAVDGCLAEPVMQLAVVEAGGIKADGLRILFAAAQDPAEGAGRGPDFEPGSDAVVEAGLGSGPAVTGAGVAAES